MLRMINDNVLIKLDDIDELKVGSFIIASKNIDKEQTYGTVIAAGPGRITDKGTLIEHDIKVGDRVAFAPSVLMNKVEYDGVNYYVVKVEHLWGVVK